MWSSMLNLLWVFGGLAFLFWLFLPEHGLFARLRRGREYVRKERREDALKFLYKCEMDGGLVSLEALAGVLGISTNAVTVLLSELEKAGLLVRQAQTYHLTEEGKSYALHIVRAHRLYERFLADHTGYEELDWHRQAEVMEHRLSPEDVSQLQARLGYPHTDPHGDPIPEDIEQALSLEGMPLSEAPVDEPLQILHVEDEPEALYVQLLALNLHPGHFVRILEKTPTTIRFWTRGQECILAPLVADNLLVSVVEKELQTPLSEHKHLSLAEAEEGTTVSLVSISPAIRGLERRRLLDLGFLPGTRVTVETESPGGDPVAYRVRGTLVALRKSQTQQMLVEIP